MRIVSAATIEAAIIEAIGQISYCPDPGIKPALQRALKEEHEPLAIDVLNTILENLSAAEEDKIPLCQDTGSLVVFAEIGNEVVIEGETLDEIVNNALIQATQKYGLRRSILNDPLYNRQNSENNAPAIIHVHLTKNAKIRMVLAQKGGGAENMSQLKMMNPSATEDDIISFVVRTVIEAGGRACPPLVIGVGIGGNFEDVALLAKRALMRPLGEPNPDPRYAELEHKILIAVNETGVGAQGLGGKCTALGVQIEVAPCHIASLPVAVNLQCHAHRHIEIEI